MGNAIIRDGKRRDSRDGKRAVDCLLDLLDCLVGGLERVASFHLDRSFAAFVHTQSQFHVICRSGLPGHVGPGRDI